jgi:hypothetical protein
VASEKFIFLFYTISLEGTFSFLGFDILTDYFPAIHRSNVNATKLSF